MNQRGSEDTGEPGEQEETEAVYEDGTAALGTAIVVLLVVAALILVAYFVWYVPTTRAQQLPADINITVERPIPTPQQTRPAPESTPASQRKENR